MIKKIRKKVLFLLILGFIIFNFNFVLGFPGISPPYTSDSPLMIERGETRIVNVELIGSSDDEELIINVSIEQDSGIAELVDNKEYKIIPGKSAEVKIKLDISEDEELGKKKVLIKFTDITPKEEGGTVSFKPGAVIDLKPVIVKKGELVSEEKGKELPLEKKEKEKGFIWILGLSLIILTIIIISVIILIIKRNKLNLS